MERYYDTCRVLAGTHRNREISGSLKRLLKEPGKATQRVAMLAARKGL